MPEALPQGMPGAPPAQRLPQAPLPLCLSPCALTEPGLGREPGRAEPGQAAPAAEGAFSIESRTHWLAGPACLLNDCSLPGTVPW